MIAYALSQEKGEERRKKQLILGFNPLGRPGVANPGCLPQAILEHGSAGFNTLRDLRERFFLTSGPPPFFEKR